MCGGTRKGHYPVGSIPACAGEPRFLLRQRSALRVYPRVCGGTTRNKSSGRKMPGLSPRVRGNRSVLFSVFHYARSIPACAGEPALSPHRLTHGAVYPRVCGGTINFERPDGSFYGLSPRVRGNLSFLPPRTGPIWSIPACAGEPHGTVGPPPGLWVYPRVCGGTGLVLASSSSQAGLSPRVRGNQGPRSLHL